MHRIKSVSARFDGVDLGELRPVDPPVRFGFASTPQEPSLVRVLTRIAGAEDTEKQAGTGVTP
jgi:hypothetical protein